MIIPQIEKLLTEQTSVILQAVEEKLSTQNRRIDGVERKVDKVITGTSVMGHRNLAIHITPSLAPQ